jgi:hypothetical protein
MPSEAFDHSELLRAAQRRPLRPGEAQALSLYITGLERAAKAARELCSSAEHITLALSHDGAAINCQFPGTTPHSVRLPLGRAALSWDFLIRALRARLPGRPNLIATAGAPTQADLDALAAASRPPIKKLPPKGPRRELTLEDLGL